ncbi:MAG: G8 domain-containing protein [Planctomycetia bacterium]|nr:G8 domain-containing protein [Planctomycetia bacterium]
MLRQFTVLLPAILTLCCAAGVCRADQGSPADIPVVRSARSGAWSDGATWDGGRAPAAGMKVLVRPGHVVTYDVDAPDSLVIRSLHIAGTVTFANDKSTRLNVGLIKIEDSESTDEEGFDCEAHIEEPDAGRPRAALVVGTPDRPIAADARALIRLTYIAGMKKESCPAIVCCAGRMDFHGAPLSRTWVKLGASAAKGAKEVTLSEPVTGWKVGDAIIVTATKFGENRENVTEQRTISAIAGNSLQFDEPLAYDHLGEGEFRGEIANLSRNVVVESADPAGERGHTMYHRYSAGSISYAEFRHLGKKDTLGRYSLHFHLVGSTMRGSSVIGASIHDSHNRWLTIHGTNYLVVRDCVGYRSVGHGFFLEDGTEVYNVLDRNLAVAAQPGKKLPKQVLPFDQNEGAGFWWANSLNTFTRNVAAANGTYGFRYEATPTSETRLVLPVMQPDGSNADVDIRTLPFVRFDDNEVHSSQGLYGINLGEGVRRVGPDTRHPFVVRNTKIWHVHYGFRPQVPSLHVENMTIRSHYGVYHPNFDNHVYRNVTILQTSTEPFNRGHDDDSVQHGVLTVDGLTFDNCGSGRMPLIQISDDNASGNAVSHFRRVEVLNWKDNSRDKAIVNLGGGPRPQPKTEKGVPVYVHGWFGPGRDALIVSTRSPEYKARPEAFHAEPPLTGDESRVAEVSNVEFPQPLDPVDDLPPATVVTHVRIQNGKRHVLGTCSDNGEVKRVVVNGREARALSPNFATWEIELDSAPQPRETIAAHAEDAAGNIEKLPHRVVADQ